MQIEEFLARVAGETAQIVPRSVWVLPSETLTRAAKSGGITMSDFLSVPGRQLEHRNVRYSHILGPPALHNAIEGWESRQPSHPLPADLQALVKRHNGIHLWANCETGRSYSGLAPIEEWDLARIKMYGPGADSALLDDKYIAISYHQDGASFVVLDPVSGKYYLMDASGPDETVLLGSDVKDLLDWLWNTRFLPKPSLDIT